MPIAAVLAAVIGDTAARARADIEVDGAFQNLPLDVRRRGGRRPCGLSLIREVEDIMKNQMRPVHPGEILREEYLVPINLSANALAQVLGVPANRISAIVAEKRAVTADTALRLARAFKTSPEFWLNLQQAFDLRTAERTVGPAVRLIKPIRRGHAA